MDLRPYLTEHSAEEAVKVLNYQPYILTDALQTGVAYSWFSGEDPRISPPLIFRRRDYADAKWAKITDLNQRLRQMYEDLLDEVAARFPGDSLLDVACNNGYFPVGAERRGMKGTGMDLGNYADAMMMLNRILGTKAEFKHVFYDSRRQAFSGPIEPCDVTVMSAIMCHIPDPLHFLAAVAEVTKKALLFWGQIVNSDRLAIFYQPRHPSLSELTDFPYNFNDNTRLTRGLFEYSLKQLGFSRIIEIEPEKTWLTYHHTSVEYPLSDELAYDSQHHALLAIR